MARITAAFLLLAATESRTDDFDAWILDRGSVRTVGHPRETSLRVGSLLKPFLVRAWASAHPQAPTPVVTCTRASGCWRPSGHGHVGLRTALRESCNTYFKDLARAIPTAVANEALREAGFTWKGVPTPDELIGLPGIADIRIEPGRLLFSYADLVRMPWASGDSIRREMLEGLRDAANDGTASGVNLFGLRAKTGTVPSLDGVPLSTSGYVLVFDDAGFAFLGLLRRGTGREAAIRAGPEIVRLKPGLVAKSQQRPQPLSDTSLRSGPAKRTPRSLEGPVRVAMLGELHLTALTITNTGDAPVDSSQGYVGPGAAIQAKRGMRLGPSVWTLRSTTPRFSRTVRGSLAISNAPGPLRVIAAMTARDYVNGVFRAELTPGNASLRSPLGAAVLRFLWRGPRHDDADVCDSTHCAWFVGDGPLTRWVRPDRAVVDNTVIEGLSDAEWNATQDAVRATPRGPDQWTADCGGDPASPHFIWGNGDRRVVSCPRHSKGSGVKWRRTWPDAAVKEAFGAVPRSISVAITDGRWTLRVSVGPESSGSRAIGYSYDEAHRRLADPLGWDALPAPASSVTQTAGGFVAEGVGYGHRVGLCLRER